MLISEVSNCSCAVTDFGICIPGYGEKGKGRGFEMVILNGGGEGGGKNKRRGKGELGGKGGAKGKE